MADTQTRGTIVKDEEGAALAKIIRAMDPLPEETRIRLVRYLADRYLPDRGA